MRKFVLSSLAALMLTASGCQQADPNAFESHLPKLAEPDSRAEAMAGISRLVKTISTSDNQERKAEFGQKVIPKFLEMWDEAKEHRPAMLEMMRDVGVTTPEAEQIWSKAVVLDGTTEARAGALLALQGVRDAKAMGVAEAIRTAFDGLIENPANDFVASFIGADKGKRALSLKETAHGTVVIDAEGRTQGALVGRSIT